MANNAASFTAVGARATIFAAARARRPMACINILMSDMDIEREMAVIWVKEYVKIRAESRATAKSRYILPSPAVAGEVGGEGNTGEQEILKKKAMCYLNRVPLPYPATAGEGNKCVPPTASAKHSNVCHGSPSPRPLTTRSTRAAC